MSFTFTIQVADRSPLTLGDLQDAVALTLGTTEQVRLDDALRGLLHLYQPGVSTRALELDVHDDRLAVRILACSSPEDHELGIAIVEALAARRGAANVEPEDGDPIPPGELRGRYDGEWVAGQVRSGAAAVGAVADANPGKLITLDGPVRPFLVGGRLIAELRQGGPAEQLAGRLIEAMRRTQWPPDCYPASVIEVSGGSSGTTRLAVLTGHGRTLLPDVDVIAVTDRAGGQLYVRPDVLADLLPGHARFLDERHLLVEAVDQTSWEELIREVGPQAVDIDQL
jgi:hypothetical protein